MADPLPALSGSLVGRVIAGKYHVLRHIGDGGMGAVVEAQNVLTGKRVAVKCMLPDIAARPEAVQRFIAEARACSRVQHPNVVEVFDLVRDATSVFIVMELLEGESLRAFMLRGKPATHELVSILLDAMHGVRAAHAQGIIHRDIKPENVFLARSAYGSGRLVKVLDFGLSKPVDDRSRVALSRVGEPMGTLHYMSREQLNGVHDVDARTDVYAFGSMLYEAFSGQVPYPAETVAELAVQFERREPVPLRDLWWDVPAPLDALIMRAIARDRDARIPSLDVMISALRPYAEPSAYAAPQVAPVSSTAVTRAPLRVVPNVPEPLPASELEPRESFPSLDAVEPEWTLGHAFAAAFRGELQIATAVRLMLSASADLVGAVAMTLWRLVSLLFVSPRRMRSREWESRPGLFKLLGRLIWGVLQVALSIVLTVFVTLWNTAQIAVSVVVFVLDCALRLAAPRGAYARQTFFASRHARQLLALVLMGIAIYSFASWRSKQVTASPGPTPDAWTIDAAPPDPRE